MSLPVVLDYDRQLYFYFNTENISEKPEVDLYGWDRGVMVTVVGKEHSEQISNPWICCLHFT